MTPLVPIEALTTSDKTKRIDQAQLFYAECVRTLAARAVADSGHESPGYREALHKAYAELTKFIDAYGPLPSLVEGDALTLFDDPVCQSREPVSMAGKLSAEGVVQLTFMPGFDEEELGRFLVGMLARNDKGLSTCNRLWESDVPHLVLDFSEEFALSDGSTPQAVGSEVNQVVERLFGALRENTADLRRFLQGKPENCEFHGEVPFGVTVIAGQPASDALKARCQTSIAKADEAVLEKAVDLVFQLVRDKQTDRPDSLEAFFTDLVDSMLRRGALAQVGGVIQRIGALEYESELAMTGYRLRCALKSLLSKPERLNVISALLVHGELDDSESVQAYLNTLDDEATQPLIELLPSVTVAENRTLLRSALVRLGKDNGSLIVSAFRESQGQQAKDLLFVISECDLPERFQCCEEALQRDDISLQLDAVSFLSSEKNLRSEQSFKILSHLIQTGSPKVRVAALAGLSSSGNPRLGNVLLTLMQDPAFAKRDLEERQRFFEALGSLNIPLALPFLSQLLAQKKKGFFGGGRIREDKLLAVRALSKMALLPSFKMLQGAAEDSSNDSKVREEAKVACASLKRVLFGDD